ncbi:MAG: hypothetical protein ACK5MR_05120 [Cumulibacter sp.]
MLERNVNGYTQVIKFLSIADLETAGFEGPVNPTTGKKGYYGVMWSDEMAKKTDSNPDASFEYINRLNDAVMSAKNTFIRHLDKNHPYGKQNIITFHSLNPWSGNNPIVAEFHRYLQDDHKKLRESGYNMSV